VNGPLTNEETTNLFARPAADDAVLGITLNKVF